MQVLSPRDRPTTYHTFLCICWPIVFHMIFLIVSGKVGLGHSRYSTAGGRDPSNTQPFLVHTRHGPLATAHNGELINAHALRKAVSFG